MPALVLVVTHSYLWDAGRFVDNFVVQGRPRAGECGDLAASDDGLRRPSYHRRRSSEEAAIA